jgi:hypothetical protein
VRGGVRTTEVVGLVLVHGLAGGQPADDQVGQRRGGDVEGTVDPPAEGVGIDPRASSDGAEGRDVGRQIRGLADVRPPRADPVCPWPRARTPPSTPPCVARPWRRGPPPRGRPGRRGRRGCTGRGGERRSRAPGCAP